MTVLVVDDEPIWRRLIETALEKAGYTAVVVKDSRRALSAVETSKGEIDLSP